MKQIVYTEPYGYKATPSHPMNVATAIAHKISKNQWADGQVESISEHVALVENMLCQLFQCLYYAEKIPDDDLLQILGEGYSLVDQQIPVD